MALKFVSASSFSSSPISNFSFLLFYHLQLLILWPWKINVITKKWGYSVVNAQYLFNSSSKFQALDLCLCFWESISTHFLLRWAFCAKITIKPLFYHSWQTVAWTKVNWIEAMGLVMAKIALFSKKTWICLTTVFSIWNASLPNFITFSDFTCLQLLRFNDRSYLWIWLFYCLRINPRQSW